MTELLLPELTCSVSLGAAVVQLDLPSPLFVTAKGGKGALDVLRAALRLSGMVPASDAFQVFLDAVRSVRSAFYRSLGVTRVVQLQEMPSVTNPATAEQSLRSIAEQTEILWMRWRLLRHMKVLFQDASAGSREDWQALGFVRGDTPPDRLNAELELLKAEIDENLAILAGDQEQGSEMSVNAETLSSIPLPMPVGSSIWTSEQKLLWKRTHG